VTRDVIAYLLSLIFSKSVETGISPGDWTLADVTAIYKKDPKHDDFETAKTLCDQFQKVFLDISGDDLLHYASNFQSSNNELSASELFTEEIVYKKLCLLKENKSLGPDAIHPHLLKNCADLLVIPLTYIFLQIVSGLLFT